MAASRLDHSGAFFPSVLQVDNAEFVLPPANVTFRKNGIEFHSARSFPMWTEMTVAVRHPAAGRPLRCTGVVVACDGSRHLGYTVSMVFLNLSRQSREWLSARACLPMA